ncbi:methionyl-tRNA formyltransferase [Paenibacillus sp. y28]|uniref:methionyl-tRNA formyltransferase n=1 Tax=Paenibacillus sp. y28 TaxID=3129110 RepID=UPI003016DA67
MNIVFMGTPEFAVASLQAVLEAGHRVLAVVTQPDRPKGRKRELTPPPVKVEALKHGLPVLQPEKLRKSDELQQIINLKPDLIVTAAYGQILPKSLLEAPAYGCINVHASLLPRYRGGAPIHYAVMNGDEVAGVTIMYMAEGLDTGDMISKIEVPITDEDTTGTMFHKLSLAGAQLLQRTLPLFEQGPVAGEPQAESEATYAGNIRREDERIDWSRDARSLFNHIRGLNPFPGAFTTWNGQVFKVWAAASPGPAAAAGSQNAREDGTVPGTVLQLSEQGIEVAVGGGSLWLTQVQPAGKKAMPASEFARGGTLRTGTVLGGEPHDAE